MKKLLLALAFIGSSLGLLAQKTNQCGFINPPPSLHSNFASVYEAGSYIRMMLNTLNWQQNFEVMEQNGINNAYATIISGQRYIVYDNNFLERLDSYTGTKWASISVLAHEMGHHYYNHVLTETGSTPAKELQADFFSGYVMEKMGASLQEAEAAMSAIASPVTSSTHPAKADRLQAISRGWQQAEAGATAHTSPQMPQASPQREPVNEPRNEPSANDADWIHLSLYSNENMTVYLSDDGRRFSTAAIKVNQPFVFKYEIYNYGWLRFGNGGRTYRLYQGHDYAIVWSRRMNDWTVVEV